MLSITGADPSCFNFLVNQTRDQTNYFNFLNPPLQSN